MVQDSRPLVETARVPGMVESEQFEVQVMAELVAESAQKCSERGGLLQDRRSEPDADLLRFRIIVSEKAPCPSCLRGPGTVVPPAPELAGLEMGAPVPIFRQQCAGSEK